MGFPAPTRPVIGSGASVGGGGSRGAVRQGLWCIILKKNKKWCFYSFRTIRWICKNGGWLPPACSDEVCALVIYRERRQKYIIWSCILCNFFFFSMAVTCSVGWPRCLACSLWSSLKKTAKQREINAITRGISRHKVGISFDKKFFCISKLILLVAFHD